MRIALQRPDCAPSIEHQRKLPIRRCYMWPSVCERFYDVGRVHACCIAARFAHTGLRQHPSAHAYLRPFGVTAPFNWSGSHRARRAVGTHRQARQQPVNSAVYNRLAVSLSRPVRVSVRTKSSPSSRLAERSKHLRHSRSNRGEGRLHRDGARGRHAVERVDCGERPLCRQQYPSGIQIASSRPHSARVDPRLLLLM